MAFLSSLSADLLISGLLCLLLVAVIALALRLDARLKTVRDSSGELHTLIKGLNEATERAHQAVAQMSAAAREHKGTLDASIVKARDLSDELSLITQSADSLASRLSQGASTGSALKREPHEMPAAFAKPPVQEPQIQDDNPRDMLKKIISGVR